VIDFFCFFIVELSTIISSNYTKISGYINPVMPDLAWLHQDDIYKSQWMSIRCRTLWPVFPIMTKWRIT